MPFTNVLAGAPSAFASTTEEITQLYELFSTQPGGGTIYLSADFENNGQIQLESGGAHPVYITSANPNEPVDVARIYLTGVDNLKITNVIVDSSDIYVPEFQGDLDVNNSSAIEISNVTFVSDGTFFYDPNVAGTVAGGRLATIDDSTDISITNTVGSGYFHAWSIRESSEITFSDNELFGIQGDGLKMREVNDVLVSNNYLHDWGSTPAGVTHSDFIQLHSGGPTDTPSTNVTITGNVLDTGNGNTAQGIWMRNEAYNGSNDDMLYRDITVTDNLIYLASANGIGLSGAIDSEISGNTLLWNSQAETDRGTAYKPRITIGEDTRGVEVHDNIAPIFNFDAPAQVINDSGNMLISYDPNASNYVGNHFVNVADGGDIGFDDWQLLDGSPFVGTGASVSQPGGQAGSGPSVVVDPEPVDPDPVDPEPVDPDPVDPEPVDPDPQDPTTGGTATATTLYAADFESGIVDLSGFDSSLRSASELNLVETPDGTGYEIGSGKMVRLDVDNDQIHSLNSFGFEMEITLLGSDDVGRFLHFPRTFEALVERDGTVTFELTTDEGTFSVNSGDVVLNDGVTHLFAVGYDDAAGTLSMSIDGTVVGKTDASGTTADGIHHGLTIGSIWGNSVDAIVDDVFLGTDPMEAGVDLSMNVGDTFSPPPAPPVGGGDNAPNDAGSTITGDSLDNFFFGSNGADTISGEDGNDTLIGEGGNDTIDGGNGNDTLLGNAGDDRILGSAGSDVIDSGSGNDIASGGEGSDTILGGDGDDFLEGGVGQDFLVGGNDQDRIVGGDGDDRLHGQNGDDILSGGLGSDTLFGDDGADNLDGGAGQDLLIGGIGNDILLGGDEADELIGGSGIDSIEGGEGNDVLNGGSGADILSGGTGADDFYFNDFDAGLDRIVDFSIDEDRLVFDQSGFGGSFEGVAFGSYDDGASTAVIYLDADGQPDTFLGSIILSDVSYSSSTDIDFIFI